MKRTLIAIIFILIISCEGNFRLIPYQKALVISYDSRKCYCLYGWKIKVDNDTILTYSPVMGNVIGYSVNKPVPVLIEIKKLDNSCRYPYYEVISIDKINN